MAKNVVVFCDGTGNDKATDPFNTNVAELYKRALHSRSDDPQLQLTHYDAGVGTEWGDLIGKATGTGISKNIQQAYDFLVRSYQPGDRIFLFGFSRGAYTVRSLGGLLGLCGVARPEQSIDGAQVDLLKNDSARARIVAEAYGVYKTGQGDKGREERLNKAAAFRKDRAYREHDEQDHPEKRAPHFIGVWDTVRSLGIAIGVTDVELTIWPHRFHDHELSEHVKYAYHALSIDDERLPFHPTIWNEPTKAQRIAKETGRPATQVFEQVWFPGVHCDVGGGYKERGLSNVTLKWMMQRALAASPPLLLKPEFADDPYRDIREDTFDVLHDSRETWWKKVVYRVQPRVVCKGTQEPDTKVIAKNGDADVSRAWLDRFDKTYRKYDSRSMREHPDYRRAVEQREAGQQATGPWQFLVPRDIA